MDLFTAERHRMVAEQIAGRGLRDPRLLAAFETVPRHLFVSRESWLEAYDDQPLPIGFDQTISQPYIVALMTSFLELHGHERLLEVGTGSGYQAAILGELAGDVHTIEIVEQLSRRAGSLLDELGYSNVHVHTADGSLGWQSAAPFDGILVTAAAPKVPEPLLDQLSDGAHLVLPLGNERGQMLEVITRTGTELVHRVVASVAFVPLVGEYGWKRR